MKRMQLVEIADEVWCPQSIRDAVTDYCRFVLAVAKPYKAIAPALAEALRKTRACRVLDLGSGAGGPWLWLQPLLRHMGVNVAVCLSDKSPNLQAFERAHRLTNHAITYYPNRVDAARVPKELPGFRTIFTAFHHFQPEQARAVLADAVSRGEGIGVFDFAKPSFLLLPFAILTPLRVLLATPFIRPFRWSRLIWTYLVPVVPLILTVDVVVSCLRMYSLEELRALTAGLDGYHWDVGMARNKRMPIAITHLIGIPIENALEIDASETYATEEKSTRP